jgi:hypothetical protein
VAVTEPSEKRPFISYAREDSEHARRLYQDLRSIGATPWLDAEELIGGQEWEPAIRLAVRECTHFLALISEKSVNKRGFVQKELRQALELLDELPPDRVFVIPIRLDNSSPAHERLARLHWIDLFPDYNEGFRRIVASLGITATSRATRPPAGERTVATADGAMPNNVLATIRSRAERDYPDDFSTRKYVIGNEIQAWRNLQAFSAPGVPSDVVQIILTEAERQYPSDFSTRLYVANNEVTAWRALQALEVPGMPTETLALILKKAELDYRHDFSTRLYVINNEIAAWRDLYT